ncbi:helix-turn-helix family protein [Burkholderia thailandensis E444]|uniref:helix-turn-helix domain-containing protein n=1 Tax=Burkholderia thailandensis TaxID=57975 RepID=UPI0003EC73CA|nr:helix-turn-helix domain-containing protein [Burkholderia thailandensis]AHI78876.1 helix-turn-helix family protein [Burkholderia thailandensis E444]
MSKDWKKVVIELCNRPGWSQTAVGAYLGVSQQAVYGWASGIRPIPARYKIRLAGMAGWDRTALALEDLLPDDVAKAWADWNNRTTEELGKKLEAKAEKAETKRSRKRSNKSDGNQEG